MRPYGTVVLPNAPGHAEPLGRPFRVVDLAVRFEMILFGSNRFR